MWLDGHILESLCNEYGNPHTAVFCWMVTFLKVSLLIRWWLNGHVPASLQWKIPDYVYTWCNYADGREERFRRREHDRALRRERERQTGFVGMKAESLTHLLILSLVYIFTHKHALVFCNWDLCSYSNYFVICFVSPWMVYLVCKAVHKCKSSKPSGRMGKELCNSEVAI